MLWRLTCCDVGSAGFDEQRRCEVIELVLEETLTGQQLKQKYSYVELDDSFQPLAWQLSALRIGDVFMVVRGDFENVPLDDIPIRLPNGSVQRYTLLPSIKASLSEGLNATRWERSKQHWANIPGEAWLYPSIWPDLGIGMCWMFCLGLGAARDYIIEKLKRPPSRDV